MGGSFAPPFAAVCSAIKFTLIATAILYALCGLSLGSGRAVYSRGGRVDCESTVVEPRMPRKAIAGSLFATWVVSAALVACTGVATGRGRQSRCAPRHSVTVARDRDVRVYTLAGKAPGRVGTYACLLRSGSTMALAEPRRYRPESIDHVALAGTIVAYTDSTHGVDTGSTGIVVINVAARRTLLTIPGVGVFIDACFIGFRDVTDLVVTDRGSVAWIVRKGTNCRTATFEVHSARTSGVQVLLEEGPAILPGSLRVSGQTVSWESGGQRRSASLA